MATTISGSSGVTTPVGAVYNGIQSKTAVSASGTAVDFTDIPSWVKRITVMFSGVSLSGTASYFIQLGTSSGVVTSGYVSTSNSVGNTNNTGGNSSAASFLVFSNLAAGVMSGAMAIVNISGNTWVESHSFKRDSVSAVFGGGDITLSGSVDRIRITTSNGTDTFDAGTINILYE